VPRHGLLRIAALPFAWAVLRGALGRSFPGANTYLLGAVPAGVVASAHGAHLHVQAAEEEH